MAHPRPLGAGGDPGADHHREDRAEAEHDQRVAEHAVAEATAPRLGVVLADGQGGQIAHATPVEIARAGVMDGVVVPPAAERRQHQESCHGADVGVGAPGGQQRPVAAVVKDDEGADQEAAGGDRQRECQPRGDRQDCVHHRTQGQVRNYRREHVDEASTPAWLRVRRECVRPVGTAVRLGHGGFRSCGMVRASPPDADCSAQRAAPGLTHGVLPNHSAPPTILIMARAGNRPAAARASWLAKAQVRRGD